MAAASRSQQKGEKVLAIGTTSMTAEQRDKYLLSEVSETMLLYLDGKIDQFWFRADGRGVVFIMATDSQDEAKSLLAGLPLTSRGLLSFEFLPIGPLRPLMALINAANPD